MPKTIICPSCGARGLAADPRVFEIRGQWQGRPVVRCTECDTGLRLRLLSKPSIIGEPLWGQMQESWGKAFPDDVERATSADESERGESQGPRRIGDGTKKLIEANAPALTAEQLGSLFDTGAARVQPDDLDRATTCAIDVIARHFAMDKNPGLDDDRYRREMGSFVITGYLVGRRVLGTHDLRCQYTGRESTTGTVDENGIKLAVAALTVDVTDVATALEGVERFIRTWAEVESKVGELGTLGNRDEASDLATEALVQGTLLAFVERDLFL